MFWMFLWYHMTCRAENFAHSCRCNDQPRCTAAAYMLLHSLYKLMLLGIIVLFLLTSMPQQYSCVSACKKSFTKSSSLAKHKNTCVHHAANHTRSQQIQSAGLHETVIAPSTHPQKYSVCRYSIYTNFY